MKNGIVSFSVIAVKKEPSHRSEMIDQLIFGDLVEIIGQHEVWLKIKHIYDEYEGWCLLQHISIISETEFLRIENSKKIFNSEMTLELRSKQNNNTHLIPFGCELPAPQNNEIHLGFDIFENTITPYSKNSDMAESITYCAKHYLNTPYLWGGKTVFGTDCSGFTQSIFRMNDIKLPRDAYQQAELGENIENISLGKAGDLAFFNNIDGKITHVGILINNSEIIHSSGYVKINKIDSTGIVNTDGIGYTHQLNCLKRIIL